VTVSYGGEGHLMQTDRFRGPDVWSSEAAPMAFHAMVPAAFMPCPVFAWPAHQPQIAEMYRVAYEFAQAQVARERRNRRMAFSVN
jgi:hypothetical protein